MIERKDKLKNKAEVAKELIRDPLATEQEIVKRTGLGAGTVNRHKQELEKNGVEGDVMDRILKMDDAIIEIVNAYHLDEITKTVENGESLNWNEKKILGDLANNSTKRKAIFGDTGKDKVNDNITIQI